jgi:hypothetical protein
MHRRVCVCVYIYICTYRQKHFWKLVLQKVCSISSVFPKSGVAPKSNVAIRKSTFSLQYNFFWTIWLFHNQKKYFTIIHSMDQGVTASVSWGLAKSTVKNISSAFLSVQPWYLMWHEGKSINILKRSSNIKDVASTIWEALALVFC